MPKLLPLKKSQPKKSRAGVGGPQSVEGKNKARFNAVKHGLKAGQLVLLLADETEEQFEALRAEWRAEFDPETFVEKTLVDELVRAHWLFQRAQRRLMEAERAIAGEDETHPVDWTEEDEHKIELLTRYKTSHERSYYRALNAVRQHQREKLNDAMKLNKLGMEWKELQRQNRELEEEFERETAARKARRAARELEEDEDSAPVTAAPEDVAAVEERPVERVFRVRRAKEAGLIVQEQQEGTPRAIRERSCSTLRCEPLKAREYR